MSAEQDARTGMRYMDHLRSVALAGVALIVEKTRTYGPSWKRRLGPGAWFTMVRPWDRLENIVEQHGGDIFAAIAADTSGSDGSALACLRDIRNYTILAEAEMVARGVVANPLEETPEDDIIAIKTALQRLFGRGAPQKVERIVHQDTQVETLALHFAPPSHSSTYERQMDAKEAVLGSVMTEQQARDLAVGREPGTGYVSQDPPASPQDTEAATGRLGAGAVADGLYTTLDLGSSRTLWHEGFGAVPTSGMRTGSREMAERVGALRDAALSVGDLGGLVATRLLDPTGDLQVLVRIPCTR